MKVQHLYQDRVALEEGKLTQAIAAAGLIVSGLIPSNMTQSTEKVTPPQSVVSSLGKSTGADIDLIAANIDEITNKVSAKYKTDPSVVRNIVNTVLKYQDPVFPTAKDLLSVIGVESSFNPNAKSALKRDPAVGLMQVRPGVWGISSADIDTVDEQIKHGSTILKKYYKQLGTREAALHAYNVGITNHKRGTGANPRYVPKVDKEAASYQTIGKSSSHTETGTATTSR